MIGAATVINPIIKIVTTVAVLAAAYFFIVHPVLDTTEKAVNSAGEQFDRSQQQAQQALHDSNLQAARSRVNSYRDSLRSGWPAAAREVGSCVQKAGDGAQELNRCVNFAQRLVHTVQSDRSFALSYADSLDGQGDSAGAERVRACVKQAGFEVAPMQRCRNLSDDLLFG
jgi:hypothetical protein